jgi:hypothetical protein
LNGWDSTETICKSIILLILGAWPGCDWVSRSPLALGLEEDECSQGRFWAKSFTRCGATLDMAHTAPPCFKTDADFARPFRYSFQAFPVC